ncbi:hypothetical protein ABPG75_011156 [Micractinium tetrahymenae]
MVVTILVPDCSGRAVQADEKQVQDIANLPAKEQRALAAKVSKLIDLRVRATKISRHVDRLEARPAVSAAWAVAPAAVDPVGGGLLVLLLGWLWQPPYTAALLFDLAIMQWQAVAALTAANVSSQNIPVGLLLVFAVPALGALLGLRGRFQADSEERTTTMQMLGNMETAALELAGELQSYSILQEAAQAVVDFIEATLDRLRELQ